MIVEIWLDFGTYTSHRLLHNVTHITFAASTIASAAGKITFLSEVHGDVVTYSLGNVISFNTRPEREVHDGFGEHIR